MPTRTQEKSVRALRFLLSLRDIDVRSAMIRCKMTAADAREGWSLLETLGTADFENTVKLPSTPKIIEELTRWQTHWFAIAEATLGRRMPDIKDRVFLNLVRGYGTDVFASVQLMIDRLAELRDPAGRLGADGPRAVEALAERGLDQAIIDQAAALLSAMQLPTSCADEDIDRDRDALWRWYLEWVVIARAEIKERALLRRMGFRMAGSAAEDTEQEAPPAPDLSCL
jgi:hypothetical protein